LSLSIRKKASYGHGGAGSSQKPVEAVRFESLGSHEEVEIFGTNRIVYFHIWI
jgi:hypothetical protein